MARAVELVDRYGPELDYDLHARLGLDLLDWFRGGHPWDQLLWLAEQLPGDSHYKAAMADDDDLVAEYVGQHGLPEGGRPTSVSLADWTTERQMLTSVIDAINAMHRTLIAANSERGKAPPEMPRLPRPESAWDRAAIRQDIDQAVGLAKLFLPNGPQPLPEESTG
jgi:hypothetical protein